MNKIKNWGADKKLLAIMVLVFSSLIAYDQISNNQNSMSLIEFMNIIFRLTIAGLIFFIIYKLFSPIFKPAIKQCPRCGSKNLNVVKPDLLSKSRFAGIAMFTGAGKEPKNLNVCRDCGFSWEDR